MVAANGALLQTCRPCRSHACDATVMQRTYRDARLHATDYGVTGVTHGYPCEGMAQTGRTLFTDSGEELCTFPDMESAARVCRAIIGAGRKPSGEATRDAGAPEFRRARE